MYLNDVIFQAHCVYFETKKEQIPTPLIQIISVFIICVDFATKFFETIWNKEF
jgi:hypothetical protein